MAEETETRAQSCAVCGRNLLIGERASLYVSREGHEVDVCELCKARAESAGWMRPDEVAAHGGGEGSRRRRRNRGELLGGLLSRAQRERERRRRPPTSRDEDEQDLGQDEERTDQGEHDRRAEGKARRPGGDSGGDRPDRGRDRAEGARQGTQESDARGSQPPRTAPGLDLEQSLTAFNASESRRTIAGLSRSLGEPRATAIAVRTASGYPGARLTVAWELAWYQWEVGPGKRGPEIRQTAKGETVDQLRAADRNWNLQMAGDGTLARRRSS